MKTSHLGISILLLLYSITTCGQTWTSQQAGNWNNASTWLLTGSGPAFPPSTLTVGMRVIIEHRVIWTSSFSSSLTIGVGAHLNINGGIFEVGSGVSMQNSGVFTGISGYLQQCVFIGCTPSGTPASGNWVTSNGGYTRMELMRIEIAGDWTCVTGGKRLLFNSCLKTGQNFSVSGAASRDTIDNSIIEVALHGSGNFQLSDASMVFNNARIWVNSPSSGSVQLSSGQISGVIRLIRANSISHTVEVDISVIGSATLTNYCLSSPTNLIDPANKLIDEVPNCSEVLYCPTVIVLPVRFTSFDASNNDGFARLKWDMEDEMKNGTFTIQRSTGSTNWEDAGRISSNNLNTYSFSDVVPIIRSTYYRIVYTDFQGRHYTSKVRAVVTNKLYKSIIRINNNRLNISFASISKKDIDIYSFNGQLIKQYRHVSPTQLITDKLLNGFYVIKITDGNRSETQIIAINSPY